MGLSIDTKNLQTLVKNFWGTTAGTFFNKFKEKASKASGNLKNVYNSLATISSVKRNKPDENKLSEIFASALSHFQRSSESESSNAPSGLVGTDVRTLTHEDILYGILEFDFANECFYPDSNKPDNKENCLRALSILLFVFGEDIKNKPDLFPKDLKDSLSFFATETTHAENKRKFKDSFNDWLASKGLNEETIEQILHHFDTNFNVVVFDNNECMCQFKFDDNDGEELKNVKVGITLSSKVGILDTLEKKFEEFKFPNLTLSWLFSGGKSAQKSLPSSDYHAVSQQKPVNNEEKFNNALKRFIPVTTSHGLVNTSGEFFSIHKYSASNFPNSPESRVYNGMAVFNFMGEIFYNRKSNQDLNNDKLLERACSKFSSSTSATELKNDSSSSEDLINTLINWNFAAQKSYGHDSPDEKNKQFTALCIILQIYQQEINNEREALGKDSKSFITNFEQWLVKKNISNHKNILQCVNDNFTVVPKKDGKQISCQFEQKFLNSNGGELTLGITISGKGAKSNTAEKEKVVGVKPGTSKLSSAEIRQISKKLSNLQSQRDALNDKLAKLKHELAALKKHNTAQKSTSVSGLEHTKKLESEKFNLENELRSQAEVIHQLELQLLGNEVDSLPENHQTADIVSIENLFSELESLSTGTKDEFAQLRNNIFEEKDQEPKQKDQEIEQQEQVIKQQRQEIQQKNQEIEQKDEVIKQQRQEIQELQQRVSTQQQSQVSPAKNSTSTSNRPTPPFLGQISGGVQHRLKKVPKSDEVVQSPQTPKPQTASRPTIDLDNRKKGGFVLARPKSPGVVSLASIVELDLLNKKIEQIKSSDLKRIVDKEHINNLPQIHELYNSIAQKIESLSNEYKKEIDDILAQKSSEVGVKALKEQKKKIFIDNIKILSGIVARIELGTNEFLCNCPQQQFLKIAWSIEMQIFDIANLYTKIGLHKNFIKQKIDEQNQISEQEQKKNSGNDELINLEKARLEKEVDKLNSINTLYSLIEAQIRILSNKFKTDTENIKKDDSDQTLKAKLITNIAVLSEIVDKINSGRNAYLDDPNGQKSWYDGLLAQIKAVGVNDNPVVVE